MPTSVTTYGPGIGIFYMYVKKHFCPDCNIKLDTAYTTETISRKDSYRTFHGGRPVSTYGHTFDGETDIRTMYFYCPKCYRRIYPSEMKQIELNAKGSSRTQKYKETIELEQTSVENEKKLSLKEKYLHYIINTICTILLVLCIGTSKIGTILGFGGLIIFTRVTAHTRKIQEYTKGLIINIIIAIGCLTISLLIR